MVVVVIVLLYLRRREGFLGSSKPLLIEVQLARSANIAFKMMVVRVALINLERVLHFLLTGDPTDKV